MSNTNIFNNQNIESKAAVIVGVILKGSDPAETEISLDELERLLDTAGGTVAARITQAKDVPDPGLYIGKGKAAEIADFCKNNQVNLAVFDAELSPSQIKNLEDELDVQVIDRSMLILDIFALHARSAEGKLQVELAQLKYTIPRLMGKGTELSRLGGGIGTRGPGESKLESDRRHIKQRIDALGEELALLEKNRLNQRKQRERSGIFKVAVVGYTNAGKSTLLNRLTGADILAENKLFATLDPTTRKFALPDGRQVLLTDTVGFIRNLPHHLIKAFKSTLDEAVFADALLIVTDISDKEHRSQLAVTMSILEELGASDKPTLYVFNKCDAEGAALFSHDTSLPRKQVYYISAASGEGVDQLIEGIGQLESDGKSVKKYFIPNSCGAMLNLMYSQSVSILETEYLENGTLFTAAADAKTAGKLSQYTVNNEESGNE